MKKYILTLAAAAATLAFSSCKKIDTIEELNHYDDCISYATDTITGAGVASDFGSITVLGDLATGMYSLKLNDFMLHAGEAAGSSTLSNLPQFMADVKNEQGEIVGADYFFFKYQKSTYKSGTMDVTDFRFGWLSSVYWLRFTAGPCRVWAIPARQALYAVRNEVASIYPGPNIEQAIHPKYTASINTAESTVTFKATGVKYPVDNTDPHKSIDIRSLEWPSLPIEFNEKGYTVSVDEFHPVIDGKTDEWVIRNFRAGIETDFDGKKYARFTMARTDGSLTLRVITDFSYNIPKK